MVNEAGESLNEMRRDC